MKQRDFKNSKWCDQAKRTGTEDAIKNKLPRWQSRVKNSGLVQKSAELWNYITSGRASAGDKLLVLGALIYLISPIDLMPDTIPVIGWLDDLGVATFVLAYLSQKLDENALDEEIPGTTDVEVIPAIAVPSKFAESIGDSGSLGYNLSQLREAAEDLNAPELIETAEEIEAKLQEPYHQVIFAGRYNTGKSTLINALIGQPVLPVGPVPTTKAITYVLHGDVPSLCSQDGDGRVTLHSSVADLADPQNQLIHDAKQISVFVQAEWLRGDICVIDSPGLEDPDFDHSALTLDAVPRADAVVMVLDAGAALSRPEYEFLGELLAADRERKVFVVLNKADTKTPLELRDIRRDVEGHLQKLGIVPRIFPLSAQKACGAVCSSEAQAAPKEFVQFRDDLLEFVKQGLSVERTRYLGERVSALDRDLRAFCKATLDLAKKDDADRAQALAAAQARREASAEKAARRQEQVEQAIGLLERRFQANLTTFWNNLETRLCKTVDDTGLDELRNTDVISQFIKDESKSIIDSEMKRVHDEIGAETAHAMYDLQSAVHGLPIQVMPGSFQAPVKTEMVVPAILILSYPLLGFFSWIYLAAGATFGRAAIEKLWTGITESVGVNRLRAELKRQLEPKLRDFGEGVRDAVEKHFNDLRAETARQLRDAANAALGGESSLRDGPQAAQLTDRARQWILKLDNAQ